MYEKFIIIVLEIILLITGISTFTHSMVKSYQSDPEWFNYAVVAVLCFGVYIISKKLGKKE
jgi:threonine/homoserine efflux transporter RhtA